ncbi:MAG: hypothetical protein JWR61_4714 [Ferruginibacter sp.]|nr:hypothetical protein [Ferruginibacter sp.]
MICTVVQKNCANKYTFNTLLRWHVLYQPDQQSNRIEEVLNRDKM